MVLKEEVAPIRNVWQLVSSGTDGLFLLRLQTAMIGKRIKFLAVKLVLVK